MSKVLELILKNVQLCLGVWQFIKITPVGALIKGVVSWLLRPFGRGVVSWLLRPFGLPETYSMLQTFDGRVFKKVSCFVLQPEISFARRGGVELGSEKLVGKYLGKDFVLERMGKDRNKLYVNGNMCYYITPTVWKELWEELQVLENVTYLDGSVECAIRTGAAPDSPLLPRNHDDAADSPLLPRNGDDARAAHDAAAGDTATEFLAARHDARVAFAKFPAARTSSDDYVSIRALRDIKNILRSAREGAYTPGETARPAAADDGVGADDLAAAAPARAAAPDGTAHHRLNPLVVLTPPYGSVVLKGHREFWEEVSTGGIMSFDEVLDGLILHNQHLSLPLAEKWLLPVNMSVSEEKLLKILNLFAVILPIMKEKVPLLIPTLLSFISALLEFSTPLRVWFYTNMNVLFCSIMHSMCDLLPRPWRRQVYSLGKWVENLKPTNDIQLKIQRPNIRAIIAGGTKIDRRDPPVASLVEVPWLTVAEENRDVISNPFRCESIGIDMTCTYFVPLNRCQIDAPTVSMFMVECKGMEEYRRIITLVSRMAKNGCGSLKSYGPHNKVSVRGFRESVLCYVKSGFPPVYELPLENIVLT